jgi:hypothetical protein
MATEQLILIVTATTFDTHVDPVAELLSGMGQRVVRVHTDMFPLRAGITMTPGSGTCPGFLDLPAGRVEADQVRSVWWHCPTPYSFPPDLPRQQVEFARLELGTAMNAFWNILDCYWVSHPAAIRAASHKAEQLQRATALGMEIPRTLISTDPERVREFYDSCHGSMVYKVLSDPSLGWSRRIEELLTKVDGSDYPVLDPAVAAIRATPTTLITEEQLHRLDGVRLAPCQFQEYVPKKFELRVTIIGDDLFAAEIHSQEDERTALDWRRYDVSIPYKKGRLPDDVASKCYRLTKDYGLNFGAIDLIVTPDDRHVFLEINPAGQWLWIQELVPELMMKEALASCLISGSSTARALV